MLLIKRSLQISTRFRCGGRKPNKWSWNSVSKSRAYSEVQVRYSFEHNGIILLLVPGLPKVERPSRIVPSGATLRACQYFFRTARGILLIKVDTNFIAAGSSCRCHQREDSIDTWECHCSTNIITTVPMRYQFQAHKQNSLLINQYPFDTGSRPTKRTRQTH